MTDQRAVALKLLGAIAVGPRDSSEFYLDLLVKAMAAAERRGMERAAKVAETHEYGEEVARLIRREAHAQAEKEEVI